MRVKFDFNLQAWMSGVEIEADSLDDAKEKLLGMDVLDLINEGYIENSDLDSIEGEVIEQDYKVKIYNIVYEVDEADSDDYEFKKRSLITPEQRAKFLAALPRELEAEFFNINANDANEDLEDRIDDEIFMQSDYVEVKSFDYDIISEK